jgi:hypothetical protein
MWHDLEIKSFPAIYTLVYSWGDVHKIAREQGLHIGSDDCAPCLMLVAATSWLVQLRANRQAMSTRESWYWIVDSPEGRACRVDELDHLCKPLFEMQVFMRSLTLPHAPEWPTRQ